MDKQIILRKTDQGNSATWHTERQFMINGTVGFTGLFQRAKNRSINSITSITIFISGVEQTQIDIDHVYENNKIDGFIMQSPNIPEKDKKKICIFIKVILQAICFHQFDDSKNEDTIDVSGIADYYDNNFELSINTQNRDQILENLTEIVKKDPNSLTADVILKVDLAKKIHQMEESVKELRALIDDDNTTEESLKEWLHKSVWVFGTNTKIKTHKLSEDHSVDLYITDGLSKFVDIVELKRANIPMYDIKDKYIYFKNEISEAIAQINHYIKDSQAFIDKNIAGNHSSEKVFICEPTGFLIVSRDKSKFSKNIIDSTTEEERAKQIKQLGSLYHDIQVLTWDDLYNKAINLLNIFKTEK